MLRGFIYRHLRIDVDAIVFSIVHRLGPLPRDNNRNEGGRCILARFTRRADVERIKAASRHLRGTRFGISEDLPAEWAATRKAAHVKYVKPAKQAGKKVRWKGQTLTIDGEEVNLTKMPRKDSSRMSQSQPRDNGNEERERSRRDHTRSPSPKPQRTTRQRRGRVETRRNNYNNGSLLQTEFPAMKQLLSLESTWLGQLEETRLSQRLTTSQTQRMKHRTGHQLKH